MESRICKHRECPYGGDTQPIDQFSKDRTRPDGLHPYCRSCRTRMRADQLARSEKARAAARDASTRYRRTDRGRQKQREYYEAHKEAYRARDRAYSQRPDVKAYRSEKRRQYAERNRLKECARHAVGYAIRSGNLSVPDTCEWCSHPANGERLEAHHWRGYEPQHWLDVKFVHATCHDACESVPADNWP